MLREENYKNVLQKAQAEVDRAQAAKSAKEAYELKVAAAAAVAAQKAAHGERPSR